MYHSLWSLKYWKLKLLATLIRTITYYKRGTQNSLRNRPLPEDIVKETVQVPSRDQGRTILVDIYRPSNKLNEPLPAIVSWHGSGFLIPSMGEDREFIVQAVRNLGCAFVDCDYRKAPEYPFPCAPEDAEDVVGWVLSQSSRFITTKVSLSGFSAGGALALVTSNAFGPDKIKSVTVLYPPVKTLKDDRKGLPDPLPSFRSGMILSPSIVRLFNACYIPSEKLLTDPKITIAGLDLERFPRAILIATGEVDHLYPGAKTFVEKLKQNGHQNATFISVQKEAHAWDNRCSSPESIQARDDVYRNIFETIRRAWA